MPEIIFDEDPSFHSPSTRNVPKKPARGIIGLLLQYNLAKDERTAQRILGFTAFILFMISITIQWRLHYVASVPLPEEFNPFLIYTTE